MNEVNLGAKSELIVAIDLLSQGYEIFRSLTPGSSCDIIRMRDNVIERVEVRTGIKGRTIDPMPRASDKDFGRFDILAVVTYTDTTPIIKYITHDEAFNIINARRLARKGTSVPL